MTRASDTARLIGAGATINDGTTITTDDNTAQLELVSTDADSGIGPHQVFYRNSASPADDDLLCELDFRGRNDNSQDVNYATVNVKANDVSDGTEDGEYILQVMTAGSVDTTMHIKPAEIVFNEDQIDRDFRVESNDTANALVVNAGTNKVGIGTASPVHPLHVQSSTDGTGLSSDDLFVAFFNNAEATNDRSFGLKVSAGSTTADETLRLTDHDQANTHLVVKGNGDVCISRTTSLTNGRMSMDFSSSADNGFCINDTASGNGAAFINFHTGGTSRGTITNNNNTAVAYNTTSDYRLKENVTSSWDASTRLKKLNPVRFNFKEDKDRTVDGFLAHEVQSVVPEAITGKHNEVDDDGNPVYQGIDQSKLVPLLVKTIQELEARITELESK